MAGSGVRAVLVRNGQTSVKFDLQSLMVISLTCSQSAVSVWSSIGQH